MRTTLSLLLLLLLLTGCASVPTQPVSQSTSEPAAALPVARAQTPPPLPTGMTQALDAISQAGPPPGAISTHAPPNVIGWASFGPYLPPVPCDCHGDYAVLIERSGSLYGPWVTWLTFQPFITPMDTTMVDRAMCGRSGAAGFWRRKVVIFP